MVLAALTNRGPLGFMFTQTMMVPAVGHVRTTA